MLFLRSFRHRPLILCLLAAFVLPALNCWAADACCAPKAPAAHAAHAGEGDDGPCDSDCEDKVPPGACPCVVCHAAGTLGSMAMLLAPGLVGTLELRAADDPLPGYPPDIFRPPLA